MGIFQKRLRALRIEKGETQEETAANLGTVRSTYGNWETRVEPDHDWMDKLADYFKVTTDYLLGRTNDRQGRVSSSNKHRMVPVIGHVKAGNGGLIFNEYMGDKEAFSLDTAEHFWLRVNGDSMEPDIKEGDLVLVRRQPTIESGELAVVIIDKEEATVKYVKKFDNTVRLVAANRYYPPRDFTGKDIDKLMIVGAVRELSRTFNVKMPAVEHINLDELPKKGI